MNKQTEALKLALHHIEAGAHNRRYIRHVIREALAEESSGTEQPVVNQRLTTEPTEFLSSFQTEKLAIERGIEWTPAIHDLCNRAIEEEKLAEQPAQQQEPVLWQILNGVCHAGVRSTENLAREAAAGMQKAHDLGGSLAAFHVRPLYTSPPASKPCKVWDAEGYDALCQQLEGWKAKASKPWVGLTDGERAEVQYQAHKKGLTPLEFMELHEAKLKEKNA